MDFFKQRIASEPPSIKDPHQLLLTIIPTTPPWLPRVYISETESIKHLHQLSFSIIPELDLDFLRTVNSEYPH